MTQTGMRTSKDVTGFLMHQHEQIKALFGQVASASGEARKQAFTELRRLLAVHETAEEEIVHPRAKSEIARGASIVSARLEEENEAKHVLAELEKLDVDSAEFVEKFTTLRDAVLAHAEHEEQEEFPKLRAELDDQQAARMGKAVALAEQMAPTRPHPGVESQGANMLAGPFAAMADRARDLIEGK